MAISCRGRHSGAHLQSGLASQSGSAKCANRGLVSLAEWCRKTRHCSPRSCSNRIHSSWCRRCCRSRRPESHPSALIVGLHPGRSGVGRPDIARREVAQTESTPVGVDVVVKADARRTLLECGVGALEDLYAVFVDGEGIADGREFEYVAVDAGSSVPHEKSEIVQGPVPADEGEISHCPDDRAVQFVAGDGVPGDRHAYEEFHFFAAGPAVSAANFDGCLYLLVLRPYTFEYCGRIGV